MTPPWLVEKCREVVGDFDLDPASNAKANETIRANRYFTKEDDGLRQDWSWARTIFLNPPVDRSGVLVKAFWQKLWEVRRRGKVRAWCWIGFSLNQLQTLQPGCCVVVPRKRVNYLDENGVEQKQPTHPSWFGFPHNRRHRAVLAFPDARVY